jgi:hypothetical protein
MANEFVKVKHEDGRTAEITQGEVAYYGTLGFEPVDGRRVARADAGDDAAASGEPMAAANGTDQRLDLILDELRGLRADIAKPAEAGAITFHIHADGNPEQVADAVFRQFSRELGLAIATEPSEPKDGDTIQLREPETGTPAAKSGEQDAPKASDAKPADAKATDKAADKATDKK